MKVYNFIGFDSEDDTHGNIKVMCLFGKYESPDKEIHEISETATDLEGIKKLCKFLDETEMINTMLVGFNLSYDLNNIHKWYPVDRLEHNTGRLITTTFPKGVKRIKGMDLMGNFIQGKSLKMVAEEFVPEIKHIDIHSWKDPLIAEACMSHTKITYYAAEKLQRQLNEHGMEMKLTAASTAFNYFINSCQYNLFEKGKSAWVLRGAERTDATHMKYLENMCYRGGRTEAYKLGKIYDKIYYYDVNSMYPFVMKNHRYPITSELRRTGDGEKGDKINLKNEGFACVLIYIPDMYIPPLAINLDKKVKFPTGYVFDYFTYPELRYAVEKCDCEIKQVYDFYEFGYADDLFDDYIDNAWDLKINPATKVIGKLLMNSLYGKFGQKIREGGDYNRVIDGKRPTFMDTEDTFYVNGVEYAYSFPALNAFSFSDCSHPLIAAYVTAYARIHLHSLFQTVGYENVVYCDTDSVMTTKQLPDEWVDEKELGKVALEWQGKVVIYAPKKYMFKKEGELFWRYRANGIPRRLQKEFFNDVNTTLYFQRPLGLRATMRTKGGVLNEWVSARKHWLGTNDKRIFDKKGNSEAVYVDDR